ncbi:MAG TPA: tRNA (adenosine(37)-N6)-threonylcarbamoyltransferase complex dimerization subunit type 1 TsaB [Ktedonobacteraceae bacterium]|nr:tRNA (adenosine(37)-N6)-threonylcarbamoyltransferase complex dimerization subunit type 1 TsaB [Ktedonobacteraceae bacterium]
MLLLALDTSTRQASIALCTEETLLGEYTWQVGNNHSVELLERIQRLVAEGGFDMSAIEAVAVATGPGSFNGLRVAVATSKALAFSLGLPLIGVSTLDIIAAHQRQWRGPTCALLEAGRSELYAACYLFDAVAESHVLTHSMRRLSDYLLDSPQQLALFLLEHLREWVGVPGKRLLPDVLFCGEVSEASRQALMQELPANSLFLTPLQSARHASVLAALAFERLQSGVLDDPLQLEPLYLRRPSITTSTRKQPLLGAKTHRSSELVSTEREEGALQH